MRNLRCRLCLPVVLTVTGVSAAHAQQETPRFTAGVELARLDMPPFLFRARWFR